MALFDYEGKLYDLPDGTSNDEAIEKIETHLGKRGSRSLSFFGSVAKPMAGALTSAGVIDKDSYKTFTENLDKHTQDHPWLGVGGQVIGTVAPIVAPLAAGPGGLLAAPIVADSLITSSEYAEKQSRGVDKETAGIAAADSGTSALLGAVGGATGIIRGAGLNALQGTIDRGVQNKLLEQYPQVQTDPLDKTALAVDAITGGVFGAFGKASLPDSNDGINTTSKPNIDPSTGRETASTVDEGITPEMAAEMHRVREEAGKVEAARLVKQEDYLLRKLQDNLSDEDRVTVALDLDHVREQMGVIKRELGEAPPLKNDLNVARSKVELPSSTALDTIPFKVADVSIDQYGVKVHKAEQTGEYTPEVYEHPKLPGKFWESKKAMWDYYKANKDEIKAGKYNPGFEQAPTKEIHHDKFNTRWPNVEAVRNGLVNAQTEVKLRENRIAKVRNDVEEAYANGANIHYIEAMERRLGIMEAENATLSKMIEAAQKPTADSFPGKATATSDVYAPKPNITEDTFDDFIPTETLKFKDGRPTNIKIDTRIDDNGNRYISNQLSQLVLDFAKTTGLWKDDIVVIYDDVPYANMSVHGDQFVIRFNRKSINEKFTDMIKSSSPISHLYDKLFPSLGKDTSAGHKAQLQEEIQTLRDEWSKLTDQQTVLFEQLDNATTAIVKKNTQDKIVALESIKNDIQTKANKLKKSIETLTRPVDKRYFFRQAIVMAHEFGHVFFYKVAHDYYTHVGDLASMMKKYENWLKKDPERAKRAGFITPEELMGYRKGSLSAEKEGVILEFKEFYANQVAKELLYGEGNPIWKKVPLTETKYVETASGMKAVEDTPMYGKLSDREQPDFTHSEFNTNIAKERAKKSTSPVGFERIKTFSLAKFGKAIDDFLRHLYKLIDGKDLRANRFITNDEHNGVKESLISHIIKANKALEETGKVIWEKYQQEGRGLPGKDLQTTVSFLKTMPEYTTSWKYSVKDTQYLVPNQEPRFYNTREGFGTALWNTKRTTIVEPKTNVQRNFDSFPHVTAEQAIVQAQHIPDQKEVSMLDVVGRGVFGPETFANIKGHPILDAVVSAKRKYVDETTRYVNTLLTGSSDGTKNEGFITSFKAFHDEKALGHLIDDALKSIKKLADVGELVPILKRNYDPNEWEHPDITNLKAEYLKAGRIDGRLEARINQDYDAILAKESTNMTPYQKEMATALYRMEAKKFAMEIEKQIQRGEKDLVPYHKGYYTATRTGNFFVNVLANGRVVRNQFFRTEDQAKNFAAKVNATGNQHGISATGVFARSKDIDYDKALELSRMSSDYIRQLGLVRSSEEMDKFLESIIASSQKVGKHQEFRQNIEGYMGSELFTSKEDLGASFLEGITTGINERAAILRKKGMTHDLTPIFQGNTDLWNTHPNTMATAKFMYDHINNNLTPLISTDNLEMFIERMYNRGAEVAKGTTKKALGAVGAKKLADNISVKHHSKVSPVKHAIGVTTRLFYISTMTTRAAFLLGQVVTPIATVPRTLLRHGSLAETMAAAGGGWKLMTTMPDHFFKAMRDAAQWKDTFTPQFTNDFNNLEALRRTPDRVNKILDILSGQTLATMADSFSRYWSFATHYSFWYDRGLRGEALLEKCRRGADESNVRYGRTDTAPVLSRLGVVGDMMRPLTSFSQHMLGALIADIKEGKVNHNWKPLISTYLMTMVLGGVVGAPLLAEYEAIRNILGLDEYGVTSIMELAAGGNDELDTFIRQGVLSGASGLDLGAGLRWNPIMSGIISGQKGVEGLFPVAGWTGDMVGAVGVGIKNAMGKDIPKYEKRNSALTVTPGGYKAIVDSIGFNALDREFVPNRKGEAGVPQTPKENLAQLLGTKTSETKHQELVMRQKDLKAKKEQEEVRNQLELLADAIQQNNLIKRNRAIAKLHELRRTSPEIASAIKSEMMRRNIPQYIRDKFGTTPSMSPSRMRSIQMYNELEE